MASTLDFVRSGGGPLCCLRVALFSRRVIMSPCRTEAKPQEHSRAGVVCPTRNQPQRHGAQWGTRPPALCLCAPEAGLCCCVASGSDRTPGRARVGHPFWLCIGPVHPHSGKAAMPVPLPSPHGSLLVCLCEARSPAIFLEGLFSSSSL